MMRLWEQLGGARPQRPDDDEWLSQYAEATTWWHRTRRGGRSPNHATPYPDVILPPCAAICLFISMWAVIGIGMDWHSGNWRGDLVILLLAVGLPLVLGALRHWRRWRA
ncbi:MAG TPA: hypothetical protein VGR74_06770 [Actinomycetota bacterium]|jgi:hypothetical protein|nr:hypothetical protein [Actinomycetota bacterium]